MDLPIIFFFPQNQNCNNSMKVVFKLFKFILIFNQGLITLICPSLIRQSTDKYLKEHGYKYWKQYQNNSDYNQLLLYEVKVNSHIQTLRPFSYGTFGNLKQLQRTSVIVIRVNRPCL